MAKTDFTKTQLLWLYFYLWQIELSVDRAIHEGWEGMVEFLSSRADIDRVLSAFGRYRPFIERAEDARAYLPRKRVILDLYRNLLNRCFLCEDELEYIFYVLEKFKHLLDSEGTPNPDELIKFRMLTYDAKGIVRKIFGGSKLDSYGCVNHFRHSEHVKVKELEELVGNA